MKIYWYAVILNPTEKEAKNGILPEFVVEPTAMIASSEETVKLKAASFHLEDVEDIERIEVIVRPF